MENREINWQKLLNKVGLILFVLFYLFSFTSKTGIDVTGGLLLLMSLTYIIFFKRDIIKNNGFLPILLLPYFIGFLLSFFSLDGSSAALNFLNRHRFILILIPLTTFIKSSRDLSYIFAALEISALASALYGIYMYLIGEPMSYFGFLAIGRFADMLVVVILINIVFLFADGLAKTKKGLILEKTNMILTALFILSLLLTYQRGSWLGFFLSITAFSLLYKRKLLILILATISLIVAMPSENRFKRRVASIMDTSHHSNVARFHLWKVGLDFSKEHLFFGTGAKNVDGPLKRFFFSKPIEYQKKYHHVAEYGGDLHNSHLQILVESGIFYFASYFISLFFILRRISKNMKRVRREERSYIIITIISTIGFLVAQFFHSELLSYGLNVYYVVLFSACFVVNKFFLANRTLKGW